MAHEAITPIKVMNIGAEHCPPTRLTVPPAVEVAPGRMKVIGHQAIMIQSQAKVLLVACLQKKKMAAIVVVAENLLAVVAAVHNVVTRFIGPLPPARGARHRQSPLEAFRSMSLPDL